MLKTLIAIRLRSTLGAITFGSRSKKKGKTGTGTKMLFAVLFAYLGIVFFGMFISLFFSLGAILLPSYPEIYLGVAMILAFSLLFVFSIMQTKTELFECKDNELLLSMPIPPSMVVVSRVFTVLIYNYIEASFVFIPAIIGYLFFQGPAVGCFGAFLSFLLIPPFATAVASGIGYAVAKISSRMRNKNLITVLISLLFLVGYMVVYFYLIGNMESILNSITENTEAFAEKLGAVGVIGSAAALSVLPTVIFVVGTVGVALLAFYLISKNYVSIVTSRSSAKRVKYVAKRNAGRSAVTALIMKELRTFFSSPNYMLNAGIGLVFCPIIAVVALINRQELSDAMSILSAEMGIEASGFIAPGMIAGLLFCLSLVMMSACSLSLEGKRLWLLRSLPVGARTVLFSKVAPQIIVSLPFAVLTSVLLFVASSVDIVYLPFFILVPITFIITTAFIGGVFNSLFPKFDFENEVQPIKQSLTVFCTMMTTMIYAIGLMIVSVAVSIFLSGIVACAIMLMANILVGAVFGVILFGPMADKFERLE